MARRRARPEPDSPERLAAAIALHKTAMARLRARVAGRPLPPATPALQDPASPSATPQESYRNITRLMGEGNRDEN